MMIRSTKFHVIGVVFAFIFALTACNENGLNPIESIDSKQIVKGGDGEDFGVRGPLILADVVQATCGPSCIGSGKLQQCFRGNVNAVYVELDQVTNNYYGNLKFSVYPDNGAVNPLPLATVIDAGSPVTINIPQVGAGIDYYLEITTPNGLSSSPKYYFTSINCAGDPMH
ncbi:MAG: hypothetical protein ACPGJS_05320 [Flammeovirgaceae bacterium]